MFEIIIWNLGVGVSVCETRKPATIIRTDQNMGRT